MSKPKSEFRFRHRNQNLGKSKHRNSDKIRLKFCRNFDFVESKKKDFRGNPNLAINAGSPENSVAEFFIDFQKWPKNGQLLYSLHKS
jgi:hypothetical protein